MEALLQLQQKDSTLLAELTNILKGSQHSAYFFETPSVTKAKLASKQFEFVLVEAQQLVGIKSDQDTFAEYFTNCGQKSVASFMNLGGDALLVAPCPMGPEIDLDRYSSLASFMRQAPQDQIKAFWLESAKAIL